MTEGFQDVFLDEAQAGTLHGQEAALENARRRSAAGKVNGMNRKKRRPLAGIDPSRYSIRSRENARSKH
jgi:hypothetical protein